MAKKPRISLIMQVLISEARYRLSVIAHLCARPDWYCYCFVHFSFGLTLVADQSHEETTIDTKDLFYEIIHKSVYKYTVI